MKLIQKVLLSALIIFLPLSVAAVFPSQTVYANHCGDDITVSVPVSDYDGDGDVDQDDHCVKQGTSLETNPIITYLKAIINFLAAGVGIVTAISLVVAGYQFMSARDNPQAITAAVHRFWNSVIALLLFFFMYAILNFLVPGGLIG